MTTKNWNEVKEVLLEGLTDKQAEVTSVLLENQRQVLTEAAAADVSATGDVARLEKVIMPLVRRVAPATMAMELVGVQPMTQSVGQITSQRVRYGDAVGAGAGATSVAADTEASGQVVYDKYSLIASGEDYDASDARTAAQITAALESDTGNAMTLEFVKKTIEAKSRKLQAKFSLEAEDDARDMHNVNLESAATIAVADEIVRELDRELLDTLTGLAGTVRAFDFASADGRYSAEKFDAITIGMSDLSNEINAKSKRGLATWMVVSNKILVALRHSAAGSFVPAAVGSSLENSAFVGTFNGNIKVYQDVYATADTILMGYNGASAIDSGLIYAPYVTAQSTGTIVDPQTYDKSVGLRSRYALAAFDNTATDLNNSSDYYARATVSNLSLGGF